MLDQADETLTAEFTGVREEVSGFRVEGIDGGSEYKNTLAASITTPNAAVKVCDDDVEVAEVCMVPTWYGNRLA